VTEPTVELGAGGLGPRERRWLILFLALGSIYFALVLADRLIGVLGTFASIALIIFLAWLLAFVMSSVVAWLQERLDAPRTTVVLATYLVGFVVLGFALFYTGAAMTQQVGELAQAYGQNRREIVDSLPV
jgi:predicted PurR-regulated permease PerM